MLNRPQQNGEIKAMNKKHDLLGISLASLTGAALLIAMLLRAFWPRFILPNFDASILLILSLISLVLDFYLTKEKHRVYWTVPLYGAIIFGLFPWLACFVMPLDALKLAVMGAVVLTVSTLAFDSIVNRLSSGPIAKIAPLISAFGLYLSAHALLTII